MAAKQRFYETPVDRTPYGSCAVVGFIGVIVFLLAAYGLVKAGGTFQHFLLAHEHTSASLTLPSANPFGNAQQELNSLEQTAQNAAKQAAQTQASAAVNQVQNAAQASVEQQVDTLKNGVLPTK